jgi:hypothetical protein
VTINAYELASVTYAHPTDTGSDGPNLPLAERVPAGAGLTQSEARKIARESGGLAVGARPSARGWTIGGWAPHEKWIVTSLDRSSILHDGTDYRPLAAR